MVRTNLKEQLNVLRKSLLEAAREHNIDIQVSAGSKELMLVELEGRSYGVQLPQSNLLLTPERVAKRITRWPELQGKPAAGHVILASTARLSPIIMTGLPGSLPSNVAVVGLWGTKNDLAASHIDTDLAFILIAAGIPNASIQRMVRRPETPSSAENVTSLTEPLQANSRFLRPDQQLDCYRLERRLGRGHSAEVWKAKVEGAIPGVNLPIGSDIALKVYFPSMMQGFQTLRIQREFAVAAELRHPSLARVYDLVLSPSRPFHTFMAMEYIDGPSLKSYIENKGKLSPQQTVTVATQLFSALQEIHSEEALHRDVKAANIMVTNDKSSTLEIKLVDLGIVSIPSEDHFTAASVFMGSKHSAPLEQLTGGQIDVRTDIYGAGSVLFHCIRGKPMYNNVGPEGAIVLRMRDRPETLTTSVSEEKHESVLVDFINRCISVEPTRRPATTADCLRQLNVIRSRFAIAPEANRRREQHAGF